MRRSIVEKELKLMSIWRTRMNDVVSALDTLYTKQKKLNKVNARLKRLRNNMSVGGKYYSA